MSGKGTVFMGLSGGVDSSVSAYLLKQQGYAVVGVFLKVWHPDFLICDWEAERLDAMRVAAHLDIPFITVDAEEAYKRGVADYFIREYGLGRTPNPDVMCNTHVKFGHFYHYALEQGADYIATGHYVRKLGGTEEHLLAGVDSAKGQSYFLWNVKTEVFSRCIFPVGAMSKERVRAIAEEAELPTAAKKDSQGICFLGHVDVREFLSQYVSLAEGEVLDLHGEVIGTHFGSELYTIGQRHGFRIAQSGAASQPCFVVSKDIEKNTITVGPVRPRLLGASTIVLSETNWIGTPPKPGDAIECVLRYHGERIPGRIVVREGAETEVELLSDSDLPASGQSLVMYRGERCLGGGII